MFQKVQMVKKTKENANKALVTELELCATNMREVLCKVFIEQLKDYDVDCTCDLFMRSTSECDFIKMITFLLKKNKAISQSRLKKIVPSLTDNLQKAFLEQVNSFDTSMKELLTEVSKLNVQIIFISQFLSEENTRKFVEKLQLPSDALYLSFPYDDETSMNINRWLKIIRDIKIPVHRCFAIVSSWKTCRSALLAGMHCIAMVDRYTAWHDFTGAEMILNSFSSADIENIVSLLQGGEKK